MNKKNFQTNRLIKGDPTLELRGHSPQNPILRRVPLNGNFLIQCVILNSVPCEGLHCRQFVDPLDTNQLKILLILIKEEKTTFLRLFKDINAYYIS